MPLDDIRRGTHPASARAFLTWQVVFLVPAALLVRAREHIGLAIGFALLGSFLTISGTYISIEQQLAKKH